MKPVTPVLLGHPGVPDVTFAKDQPQYLELPAVVGCLPDRIVTTRWHLTWRERIRILLSGQFWHQQMTFGGLLQPIKMMAKEPSLDECDLSPRALQEQSGFRAGPFGSLFEEPGKCSKS